MNIYLVAAFLLLLAMLALVMRPFFYATEPTLDGPVDLSDPAAKARAVAKVERVRRPDAPAAATTVTPAAPPVAETPPDDVRASVEAAIAARKAALKAKHCTACEAVLENGDAFCRSCGTKVTA